MNLYKISQSVNDDYDTYDAAIVAAESTERARLIHPHGDEIYGVVWNPEHNAWVEPENLDKWYINTDWTSPENVQVELIGIAAADVKEGVVLASFNAG